MPEFPVFMAVTGEIGAGKSTVAKLFQSLGWAFIDADKITAELWKMVYVMKPAAKRWGNGILVNEGYQESNNRNDRIEVIHSKIADIIFNDRLEYDWAMALLCPIIKDKLHKQLEKLKKKDSKYILAEIQMLFEFESEIGLNPDFKIFVTAPRDIRLERCVMRGWDEAEMSRRERFFIPSEQRMALSDFIIYNNGSLEELRSQVYRVFEFILAHSND